MRRATITTARALVALLLAAAALDLPLPRTSSARVRLHLVDRSASVETGPSDALKPRDIDRIIEWDRLQKRSDDVILAASFASRINLESTFVDPSSTRLEAALRGALARNPTEVVLYSDGRGDPGDVLLLYRERGVPIHVLPIGPVTVRDARIVRVAAPGFVTPGERFSVELTVEATFAGTLHVGLDGEERELTVTPGVPVGVAFPNRRAGPFRAQVRAEGDECPQNNIAAGAVQEVEDRRRVLAVSRDGRWPAGPEIRITPQFENPGAYDAVVLDGVELTPPQQRTLAEAVEKLGVGLVLVGGPFSHALGRWTGTPLEAVSPLRSQPDHRVAVVFGIDASGSMQEKLPTIRPLVQQAWRDFFGPGDDVVAMAFSGQETRFVTSPDELRTIMADKDTFIAHGINEARKRLEQSAAARKMIVLLTDGEVSDKEEPGRRLAAAAQLGAIDLAVVTTNKELNVGRQHKIENWAAVREKLRELTYAVREVERRSPGTLDLHPHPVSEGVARVELPWMNRTTAKPGAQIAATVGRAPAQYPALAIGQAGRGRVAAFAFPYHPDLDRLFRQAIDHVAGQASEGLSLSLDPPRVRARGMGPPEIEAAWLVQPSGEGGSVKLRQTGADAWEGALPETPPGTLFVRRGRARAAATIPCAPEFAALGIDPKALERIAAETGGRMLRRMGDLEGLARPARREGRSGRVPFLLAALVLLFAEMALSTFWKPR